MKNIMLIVAFVSILIGLALTEVRPPISTGEILEVQNIHHSTRVGIIYQAKGKRWFESVQQVNIVSDKNNCTVDPKDYLSTYNGTKIFGPACSGI